MINIRRMWQPLTATPFLATAAHHEILPCESLQRWIRAASGAALPALAHPRRALFLMFALTSSTTLTKRRDASFKRVSAASATCAALRICR